VVSNYPCECGCGEFTSLATQTEYKRDYVKGQPMRFRPGHAARCQHPPFEEFIEKDGPNGCWLWTGRLNRAGYGTRGNRLAHRMSYEKYVGPIGEGLFVCHRCDNPPCVNPSHLFLGIAADNMADMVRKGRACRDIKHSKVSREEVDEIRLWYRASGISQQALADTYGICQTQVSKIVRGLSW
jgi:hypothetical protein